MLAALFCLWVILGLNRSSIGEWNELYGEGGSQGPWLNIGQPQAVRADEWLVTTPFILSQDSKGFPLANSSIGANNDPLLLGLPVSHATTILRPQLWGFFILGVERGFSFYWGYKVFALIGSSFLLLMLLTGNRLWLSVAGSLLIFFSSYIQWWFSAAMPEMLTAFSIATVSMVYMLLSGRRASVIIAAGAFAVSAFNFVLMFYPPYQVVLAYVAAAIVAGILLEGKNLARLRKSVWFRAAALGGSMAALALLLALFYRDAAGTIQAVLNTVYPGHRPSNGGEETLPLFFSGFTFLPHSGGGFPAAWENPCEASGFVLLFPIVCVAILRDLLLKRSVRPVAVLMAALTLFLTVWIIWGMPSLLARISLLSFVPGKRAMFGLGICSILLTMVYLSGGGGVKKHGDKVFAAAVSIISGSALIALAYRLHGIDGDFFSSRNMVLMVLLFAVLSFFLIIRRSEVFLPVLLALSFFFTALVNPVTSGLGAIRDKAVYRQAEAFATEMPQSRWIVYGNNPLAGILKAGGLNVANGYQYTPDLAAASILDPQSAYEEVYNRYANIIYALPKNPHSGEVIFSLKQADMYSVTINPCNPALQQMGITNFAFSSQPYQGSVSCLEPIATLEDSRAWFYARKS